MVDQIRVDQVLQVSAAVVRQQDVHRLGRGVRLIRRDAVVDRVDDIWVRREKRVGLHFFKGLRDGFLAEGAADLLQGEELLVGIVLDEVDVGKAALGAVLEGVWQGIGSGRACLPRRAAAVS